MSGQASIADFIFGVVVGTLFSGFTCGVYGLSEGVEQGIMIGESRTNAARDKAYYETCNLVRTFTPKNSPAVECYVCPGYVEETCLVPSWKGEVPK